MIFDLNGVYCIVELFGDSASKKVTTRGLSGDTSGRHINIVIDPIQLAFLDN